MARFFAVLLILLLTLAGLFLIFLSSPLPKSLLESYVVRVLPETGYFKIRKAALLPWRPLEFQNVEYQLRLHPKDGILKTDLARFESNFQKLVRTKQGKIVVRNLSFVSEAVDLRGLNAEIPLELSAPSVSGPENGFIKIDRIDSGSLRLQNVSILFQETANLYAGDFRIEWMGGRRLSGQFRYEPFARQLFSVETAPWEISLTDLSSEVGGVFERATGQCSGSFKFSGGGAEKIRFRGKLACPRPGGRIKAKFLRDLAEWIPEGTAKKVFQEEVEGKEDYYYDEASLEVSNDKPGYWTFHLVIRNPRLHLDMPIDISDNSFGAVFGNAALRDIMKKWSGSHA